ncbi:MAG: RagB/SusD family nutrient uptake outer membrane protein [Ekhidna sp.]
MRTKLLALITVSLLWSCSDFLEPEPQQSIPDTFERNAAALINMANGMYDELQDSDLFGMNLIGISGFAADDAIWQGSFTSYTEIATKGMLSNNGEATGTWQDGYQAINRANTVLLNVPLVNDFQPNEANQLTGEAYFIRALVHFELAKWFSLPWADGNGSQLSVPVILDPTTESADITSPSRNNLGEVIAQVIADAEQAIALLDATGSRGINFASADAARALLMNVYLYQGDYANALSYANQLISSNRYALEATPLAYVQRNTGEAIFEILMNDQDNPGNLSLSSYHRPGVPDGSGRGDIVATASLLAAYWPNDLRNDYLVSGGQFFTNKFPNDGTNTDNPTVYRYAEVLLTAAEALVETTNSVDPTAVGYVSEIYTRAVPGAAALTVADFASVADLRARIRLERRLELAWDGHRLHDLRRYQAADVDGTGTSWNADELVWPIPQRDMDANPNLVQNPGY